MAREKATWAGRIVSAGYRVIRRNERGKPRAVVTVEVVGGSQHGRRIDIILTAEEARGWAKNLTEAADYADANAGFLR
jgi:hypothetical protein